MDNVRRFPDFRSIDKEATAWLARLDADQALETDEREALREWLSRSAYHRKALTRLNQFWGNNILTELMVPLGRYENQENLLAQARRITFGWPKTSAVAFAGIALLLAAMFLNHSPPISTNGLYVTAVGQQKTVVLDDGSQIHLNTNSQLEVNYGENHRNLRLLQGEAYFEVEKNPDRPFRVYAGAGRVQAVGTAFNVHLDNGDMNLLVTEGRVALASLGAPLTEDEFTMEELEIDLFVHSKSRTIGTLDAGEFIDLDITEDLYISKQEIHEEVEVADHAAISRVHSWREGYLFFSGEPLEEVVSEISRYTTVSIEITDPDLKQLQIGGRFKMGDTDAMFAALETNFGIAANQLNYNKIELMVAKN